MSIKNLLNMCMIYADTPVCEWHITNSGLTSELPVAVYHIPFPITPDFQNKINHAINQFHKIVILCSELHPNTVEFIQNNQHPKITYFICGFIQGLETNQWMDWFITTAEIYKNNSLLSQLSPYSVKPKYFDALLGWAKPHRQIIYDQFKDDHRIILSYLQNRNKPLTESGWITSEDCTFPNSIRNTVTRINYHNQEVSISQIIPFAVYNQSAYSIVAETNFDNDYSFYTEKIVKPILAKRLFVVFSGQYYLANLRKLGFKTFDSVVDESYDQINDPTGRFNAALKVIDHLLTQPQEKILQEVKLITEYNFKHLMTTDWYENFLKNFSQSLQAIK